MKLLKVYKRHYFHEELHIDVEIQIKIMDYLLSYTRFELMHIPGHN